MEHSKIQSKMQAIMEDYRAMKRSQLKKLEIRQKTANEKVPPANCDYTLKHIFNCHIL